MSDINKINEFATEMINDKQKIEDEKEDLEKKAEKNHLYKIDKEDKKYWRECEEILEQKKIVLNEMIHKHLMSLNIGF
jgi:hypothetical protein